MTGWLTRRLHGKRSTKLSGLVSHGYTIEKDRHFPGAVLCNEVRFGSILVKIRATLIRLEEYLAPPLEARPSLKDFLW